MDTNDPLNPPVSSMPPADPPEMQRLDRLLMWHAMGHANKLKVNEPKLTLPPPQDAPHPSQTQRVPLTLVAPQAKP